MNRATFVNCFFIHDLKYERNIKRQNKIEHFNFITLQNKNTSKTNVKYKRISVLKVIFIVIYHAAMGNCVMTGYKGPTSLINTIGN